MIHTGRNKMAYLRELVRRLSCAIVLLLCSVDVVSSMDMISILPPLCSKHTPEPKINTALLTIHNDESMHREVLLYAQSAECYECDLIPLVRVNDNCTVRVDTRWATRLELRLCNGSKATHVSPTCSEQNLTSHFQEGGDYSIFIQSESFQGDELMCISALTNDPADPNIPIYVALGLCFYLILFCQICFDVYRKGYIHRFICFWSTESMMSDLGPTNNINNLDDGTTSEQQAPPAKERLKSLDTFRGIAIVVMIFVNYGGGGYWFFKHSKWNGLTVADLVFPWFVFIMGTSMVFSIRTQVLKNKSKWTIFCTIVRRSLTLFFLGLIINSRGSEDGVDLSKFRIPGVLQRFAGTYLITATCYLFLSLHNPINQAVRFPAIRDLTDSVMEWVAQLFLVAIQLAVTLTVPVPGCPAGYLGPGGMSQGGKHFNCTGGVAGYIDRKMFGENHIYGHPTCTEIYHGTVPYDPEGLLGTLNSCFICFLGLQAGKIIVTHSDWVKRSQRFFVWAIVLAAIGALLCKCSLNEGWIPINKNLWSLSFVLVLAGMAFFLFLICYILIDVYKLYSGMPFYFAGMNAIALYIGHEFLSGRFPVAFSVAENHAAQLSMNIWGTLFWILVSVYLYYKDIFISV